MRLENISKDLVQNLSSSINAEVVVENLFWKCVQQIDNNCFDLIGSNDIAKQIRARIIPTSDNLINLVEQLDKKYFEAEDNGLLDLSSKYFSLARLMTSLDYLKRSDNPKNLYESAYEALMSVPNPNIVLKGLLSQKNREEAS